jgi:hypothetical protein
MEYPLLSQSEIKQLIPTLLSYNVSKKAFRPDGFLYNYLKNDSEVINQPSDEPKYTWGQRRRSHLRKKMYFFKSHETFIRYLNLIIWGYQPEVNDPLLKIKITKLKNKILKKQLKN